MSQVSYISLYQVQHQYKSKLTCEVVIERSPIVMQMDTEAEVSIISEGTHKTVFPKLLPAKFNVLLIFKAYSNEMITVIGELSVKVQYVKQTVTLTFIAIFGSGQSIREGLAAEIAPRLVEYVSPNFITLQ